MGWKMGKLWRWGKSEMQSNKTSRISFLLTLCLCLAVTLLLVRGIENRVMAGADSYEDLKVFTEALSALQRNYVEPVDTKKISHGAIKGMLNALDAHSDFMPADVYKEMQIDTKGEFGGLGIQIGSKNGRLVVIAPIEGTPAERAGIKSGDFILKVDDAFLTKDMSLMDAVNKMRGVSGTQVSLTIQREPEPEPRVFKLTREIIQIKSVKSKLLEPGIGHVRVTQFQEQTAADLEKELAKLKEEKIESLVLDLRNNPGGLLTAAIDVTEMFLPPGKVVVSVRGREGQKEQQYLSERSRSAMTDIPMIVLVNEGSASASEIVSGAVQDWGRALILGTQTFGKGSVQTILPLSDGSALRLTTARYYTPNGRSIQNTGVTPDIVVKPAQTKNPLMVIREKDLERHLENDTQPAADNAVDPTASDPPAPSPSSPQPNKTGTSENSDPPEDVQLQKAVDLLKSWKIFKNSAPIQTLTQAVEN
jgi:carboxyl-terminal processing protease